MLGKRQPAHCRGGSRQHQNRVGAFRTGATKNQAFGSAGATRATGSDTGQGGGGGGGAGAPPLLHGILRHISEYRLFRGTVVRNVDVLVRCGAVLRVSRGAAGEVRTRRNVRRHL